MSEVEFKTCHKKKRSVIKDDSGRETQTGEFFNNKTQMFLFLGPFKLPQLINKESHTRPGASPARRCRAANLRLSCVTATVLAPPPFVTQLWILGSLADRKKVIVDPRRAEWSPIRGVEAGHRGTWDVQMWKSGGTTVPQRVQRPIRSEAGHVLDNAVQRRSRRGGGVLGGEGRRACRHLPPQLLHLPLQLRSEDQQLLQGLMHRDLQHTERPPLRKRLDRGRCFHISTMKSYAECTSTHHVLKKYVMVAMVTLVWWTSGSKNKRLTFAQWLQTKSGGRCGHMTHRLL